jgi:hypothetical protein
MLGIHNGGEFLDQLSNYYLLRKGCVSCSFTNVWDVEQAKSYDEIKRLETVSFKLE